MVDRERSPRLMNVSNFRHEYAVDRCDVMTLKNGFPPSLSNLGFDQIT